MSSPIKVHNLLQWIDENKDHLQPPVCNKEIYQNGEMIIMVVGGPNNRKDYHYNETPEFFYQIKGNMVLKIIEEGKFKDIAINEGEIYLLGAKIPHSPQRFEDTVGLVIEQVRPEGVLDACQWFCESCSNLIHKETFSLSKIDSELPKIFDKFYKNIDYRTCDNCKKIMDKP